VKREELTELHYITPIVNLPTIMRYGIQSHRRVEVGRKKGLLLPVSISMQDVQDLRAKIRVPGHRPLHEYANLYICARNPMLYKRKDQHRDLCVLRISTGVLDIEGAIISDRNAAARVPRFSPSPAGLAHVGRVEVFAEDWRHPGKPLEYARHKAVKCAEVLIPDKIPPVYITGAYVSSKQSQKLVVGIAPDLNTVLDPHLFFVGSQEPY
jgi:hypothetical protein